MKKIILLLVLMYISFAAFAQVLTLTGRITNTIGEPVELNLPFDGDYHSDNSVYSKPTANGSFKFSVPGTGSQFAHLRYNKQDYYLLLEAGKPLQVNLLDSAKIITVLGTAKADNDFFLKSAINNQSFLINKLSVYRKWSADSLINIMLPTVNAELEASLKSIAKLKSTPTIKTLLTTELKYYYANNLMFFTRSIMSKISRQAAWKKVEDLVVAANPLPTTEQLATSPNANTYLHEYALHQFKEVALTAREKPAESKTIMAENTGMPNDTAIYLTSQYGEDYLMALIAHKHLPQQQEEKLLANMALKYTDTRELKFARRLQQDLQKYFPNSPYLKECNERITAVQNTMAANERNKSIVFVPATANIATLKDLVAPYKGKAVYVDIWGTWCAPCMQEITEHSAELNGKFKDKNIVFIYLEMDYENANDDKKWKEFVYLHNMAGVNVRATQKQMESFWVDLLHTQNVPRIFPTYIIVDAQGNLVDKNAKRPSDKQKLYADLEAAINK